MIFRALLALLVVGGLAVGGTAMAGVSGGWVKIKSEKQRDAGKSQLETAKNERKVVPVPEPSVVLLSALGMGCVLVGGWFVRRNHGGRPE